MSLTEQIATMPLATLLACRTSYEQALAQPHPALYQAVLVGTLAGINQELARRLPPGPSARPSPTLAE